MNYYYFIVVLFRFRKKVCKLDRGEFMLDYHLPHLLLVFPSGTALHDLELYKSKSLLIQDKVKFHRLLNKYFLLF